MNHLKAINTQGGARRARDRARRRRAAAHRAAAAAALSRSAARWCSRRAGKRTGPAAPPGLCQPVERDLFDCHIGCYWPAQVPDQLNHAPDWTAKCAAAQKDWRKIDLIFP